MTSYTDRFESHPVHNQLANFANLFEQVEEAAGDDSSLIEDVERLRAIHSAVNRSFNSADPFLIAPKTLDRVRDLYGEIMNELTAFISNKNPAHLINANSHSDQLLPLLSQFPATIEGADVELVRESVTNFRRSVGQYLRYVDENVNVLNGEMETLSSRVQEAGESIEAQKSRLDTAITQFQQQFSEAEESRRSRYADEEARRSSEISSSLEGMQTQIETSAEEFDQRSDEVIQLATVNLSSAGKSLKQQAAEHLAGLEELLQQAQELVFVIANTGMAGGYQKIANQERRASYLWKFLAVGSMIGLIVFAVYAFQTTEAAVFSVAQFAARALVTSTFGILAAFSARQASKHDDKERYNRKMELEMASIDPFLAGLPEDIKNQVKAELAQGLFAQKLPELAVDSGETTGSLLDLLRVAIEGLSKGR